MRSRWTLPLVAVAVAACDNAITAPAASSPASASEVVRGPGSHTPSVLAGVVPGNYTDGRVRIKSPFNPTITDRYTYWAERTDDGRILGKFSYSTTLANGPANVSGKVLCFTITGPKARLGGVVTASDNASIPVGSELTWSVTDNWAQDGDPDDTASPLLGAPAQPYCALGLPYPESPLLGYTYVYVEYVLGRV